MRHPRQRLGEAPSNATCNASKSSLPNLLVRIGDTIQVFVIPNRLKVRYYFVSQILNINGFTESGEEQHDEGIHSVASSSSPPPAPNHLGRQKKSPINMPGSLYPRSPTPDDPQEHRRVRFASDVRSPLHRSKFSQFRRDPNAEPTKTLCIHLSHDDDELRQSPSEGKENMICRDSACSSIMPSALEGRIAINDTSTAQIMHPHESGFDSPSPSSFSGLQPGRSSLRSREHSMPVLGNKFVRHTDESIHSSPSSKQSLSWQAKEKWKATERLTINKKERSDPNISSYPSDINSTRETFQSLESFPLSEKTREGEPLCLNEHNVQEYVRALEEKVRILESEVSFLGVTANERKL